MISVSYTHLDVYKRQGQTRAQERGYRTVFTEGDRIGLYVVKDGTLEVENLCLTLQLSLIHI